MWVQEKQDFPVILSSDYLAVREKECTFAAAVTS